MAHCSNVIHKIGFAAILECIVMIFILSFSAINHANDLTESPPLPTQNELQTPKPALLGTPLLERYILDELRAIRQDQLKHEANVTRELAQREFNVSDRAIAYTTDTVNNIFYIITAAATILVIAGLSSLRDAKTKIEELIEVRTGTLAIEYEQRLKEIEAELKTKSKEIIDNQQDIAEANHIHSIWMRTGIETNSREKIRLYDEILSIRPDDIEAITYKADAAIELEEFEWALKLSNQAMEFDKNYSLAYWQRACAYTGLDEFDAALDDIRCAIDINPSLKEQLNDEEAFIALHKLSEFKQIL